MIGVEEALDLVDQYVKKSPPKLVDLKEALGLLLTQDVKSPIDMPPFHQSAMDGYALHYSESVQQYTVLGEVAAGSSKQFDLKKGEAVRIFTGAAVPDSANTVVRQEDVIRTGNSIAFTTAIEPHQNIRYQGEQIKKGAVALEVGTELSPAGIGFLASLGIHQVEVSPRPKISILTTGNELIRPGDLLEYGKVYESNSVMLESAFRQFGFFDVRQIRIPDQYEQTVATIESCLIESDLLIISGGISVGDYDFVGKAVKAAGVKEVFYKVKQKPGKPLYFGHYKEKLIFALPGNPAAAMTSFYLYILPTLSKWIHGKFNGCSQRELPLFSTYEKKGNRAEFLKAFAFENEVRILDGQSSAMLRSFAQANALVYIPEDISIVEEGEFVLVLML
ncbi:MAG: gephyrin-like molybdotransferase Glp [Crocinitomicaceae bacterium]